MSTRMPPYVLERSWTVNTIRPDVNTANRAKARLPLGLGENLAFAFAKYFTHLKSLVRTFLDMRFSE